MFCLLAEINILLLLLSSEQRASLFLAFVFKPCLTMSHLKVEMHRFVSSL